MVMSRTVLEPKNGPATSIPQRVTLSAMMMLYLEEQSATKLEAVAAEMRQLAEKLDLDQAQQFIFEAICNDSKNRDLKLSKLQAARDHILRHAATLVRTVPL